MLQSKQMACWWLVPVSFKSPVIRKTRSCGMPDCSFKDYWPSNYILSDRLCLPVRLRSLSDHTHSIHPRRWVSWAFRMDFTRPACRQSELLSLFSSVLVVGLLWSKKECKSNNILWELFFSRSKLHHLDKLWSIRKVEWEFLLKAVSKSLRLRASFFLFFLTFQWK